MTTTTISEDEVTVEGSVFLLDGVAFLHTSNGFYELPCEEFFARCREYIKEAPTLQASLIVRRERSTDYESPGFGYPEHRIASTEYAVPLMYVSSERESFNANKDVCRALVGQEIGKEFR